MKLLGIKNILNLTFELKNYYPDDFNYYNIIIKDELNTNIIEFMNKTNEIIENSILNNEKILVHCCAGVSRSASIVILYIMKYKKLNLYDSYLYVQNLRPKIFPNESFRLKMAQYLFLFLN